MAIAQGAAECTRLWPSAPALEGSFDPWPKGAVMRPFATRMAMKPFRMRPHFRWIGSAPRPPTSGSPRLGPWTFGRDRRDRILSHWARLKSGDSVEDGRGTRHSLGLGSVRRGPRLGGIAPIPSAGNGLQPLGPAPIVGPPSLHARLAPTRPRLRRLGLLLLV